MNVQQAEDTQVILIRKMSLLFLQLPQNRWISLAKLHE